MVLALKQRPLTERDRDILDGFCLREFHDKTPDRPGAPESAP